MSTVTAYANGTAADGALTGWTNPTYVYSADGTAATRTGTTKNEWYGQLYTFNFTGMPASGSLTAATITAYWKNSAADTSGPEFLVGAQYNGAVLGSAVDTTGGTAYELTNYALSGVTYDQMLSTGANGFYGVMRFRRTDNTAHTASVDYLRIYAVYTEVTSWNVTPASGSQTQSGNAAVVSAASNLTPASGSQTQTTIAPNVYAGYPVSGVGGSQSQTGNSPDVYAGYPVTPSANSQTQSGGAPEVSFDGAAVTEWNTTPADNTQTQSSDPITVYAAYNLTPGSGAQSQSMNAPVIFSAYNITPGIGTQSQSGIVPDVYAGYNLTANGGGQSQTMSLAEVLFQSPVVPDNNSVTTPIGGMQSQTMSIPDVIATYFILTSFGYQTQTGSPFNIVIAESGWGKRTIFKVNGQITSTGKRKVFMAATRPVITAKEQ